MDKRPNPNRQPRRLTRADRFRIALIALFLIAFVVAAIVLMPFFMTLAEEEGRAAFRDRMEELGFAGVLLLLGVQVLQIVIAVIPGEAVELLAGFFYGAWGGYALCTVGVVIGSALVFSFVRAFGVKFVALFLHVDKLQQYRFLNDAKRRDMLVFLLFLIPGTPKDALTYIIPFTKMHMGRFLLLSTFARTASIVSSTYAGAALEQQNYTLLLILFAVIGGLGALGIVLHERWMARLRRKR